MKQSVSLYETVSLMLAFYESYWFVRTFGAPDLMIRQCMVRFYRVLLLGKPFGCEYQYHSEDR